MRPISDILQALSVLDINISIPVLVTVLFGLIFIILSLARLRQLRIFAAFINGLGGLCLVLLGGIFLLVAFNIHTYQRLTYEKPVASLAFTQTGPQEFQVLLENLEDGTTRLFQLQGDEWQIDARILRWKPTLQILGANTLFRLERLNGRYSQIDDEKNKPRTVYALYNRELGLDLWSLGRKYSQWLKWLDAYYGSAAYLPMEDGAIYTVSINQTGLIARPENIPAKDALSTWD